MLRVTFLIFALSATASLAAEPVYPPGSRIGLAPPKDMELSKRFTGFEDPAKGAAITLVEMPPEAYQELSASLTAENLRAQGVILGARQEMKVGERNAVLISGEQSVSGASIRKWLLVVEDPTTTAFLIAQAFAGADALPDHDMRAALTSVAIRGPIAMDEQLALLPFRLTERAGFRPIRVLTGNSLLMTDGAKDVMAAVEQPFLIVAQSATPAPPAPQRDAFARSALASNANFKDVLLERSQSFRQKGADWHEIVARAIDAPSGQPVVVTQVIRFAPGQYTRMLGVVRADARDAMLPRFRAVFDGVEVN
jgi:hypothetical protein